MINELKGERPSAEVFAEKWLEIKYRQSTQTRSLIKYILDRINQSMEKSREKIIDFDVVNIEHFVPQNPSAKWKLTKDEAREFMNLLGNLTLVDKKINASVGNKDAKSKIAELSGSSLAITKDFIKAIEANKYEWRFDNVTERQVKLGKLAYENIWTI